jgi:hypothetical protein
LPSLGHIGKTFASQTNAFLREEKTGFLGNDYTFTRVYHTFNTRWEVALYTLWAGIGAI